MMLRMLPLALFLALSPALARPAPAPGPETPRACWQAVDEAVARNDQARFWDLLSERSRKKVAAKLNEMKVRVAAALQKDPTLATKPVGPDGKLTMRDVVRLPPRDLFVRGVGGQVAVLGARRPKLAFISERIEGSRAVVEWDEGGQRQRGLFVREAGGWRYDETPGF